MRIFGLIFLAAGVGSFGNPKAAAVFGFVGFVMLQVDSVHLSIDSRDVRIRTGLLQIPLWRFPLRNLTPATVVRVSLSDTAGLGLRFGRKSAFLVVRTGPVILLRRSSSSKSFYLNAGTRIECDQIASAINARLDIVSSNT